jgi:hypothetical protein
LAAILFPVFARARLQAMTTSDISNQNQIGKAHIMYSDDNGGQMVIRAYYHDVTGAPYPKTPIWIGLLKPYTKDKGVYADPTAKGTIYGQTWETRQHNSIGLNTNISGWYNTQTLKLVIVSMRKMRYPTKVVFNADGCPVNPLDPSRDVNCRGYLADNQNNTNECGLSAATTGLGARHSGSGSGGTVVQFMDGHSKKYDVKRILPNGQPPPSTCWQQAYVDMNDAHVKWLVIDDCVWWD